jgi:hypothetical protein
MARGQRLRERLVRLGPSWVDPRLPGANGLRSRSGSVRACPYDRPTIHWLNHNLGTAEEIGALVTALFAQGAIFASFVQARTARADVKKAQQEARLAVRASVGAVLNLTPALVGADPLGGADFKVHVDNLGRGTALDVSAVLSIAGHQVGGAETIPTPLARQRMDSLLLPSDRRRVVIEIDGEHHYANDP